MMGRRGATMRCSGGRRREAPPPFRAPPCRNPIAADEGVGFVEGCRPLNVQESESVTIALGPGTQAEQEAAALPTEPGNATTLSELPGDTTAESGTHPGAAQFGYSPGVCEV